jgi:hypothetical protein
MAARHPSRYFLFVSLFCCWWLGEGNERKVEAGSGMGRDQIDKLLGFHTPISLDVEVCRVFCDVFTLFTLRRLDEGA